jgi:Glycosyltransferase
MNAIWTDMITPNDWGFKKQLELETKEKWVVENRVANGSSKNFLNKFFNVYIRYFGFALNKFFSRKKYDKVISWQQFFGIIFAFYCLIFKIKKYPKIYIIGLNYKEKRGYLGKIYYKFMKVTLESKYVYKIIVETSQEVTKYSRCFSINDKIFYCLGGIDNIKKIEKSEKGKYYLSVGRTNRDYNFLINCFKVLSDESLIIICDKLNLKSSKNVSILRNVFDAEYEKYLSNSFALILSLGDDNVSSGQLSAMHAMMYKKPIIVTKNTCLNDCLFDNINCIVIDKKIESLKSALLRLENDPSFYNFITENAYSYFINNFTIDSFGKRLGKLI